MVHFNPKKSNLISAFVLSSLQTYKLYFTIKQVFLHQLLTYQTF